ncbi:HNH endonuclease, partial [Vibrio cholerae]|nr:HNH endonuclease [Vibrio cholerae]
MCDYGAIELSLKEVKQVSSHSISQKSIDYHNKIIR